MIEVVSPHDGDIHMKTIQARVNARLLKKADRLFTGTLNGRIIEILQNARRAGATKVEITNTPCHAGEDAPCRVMVRDNGRGIDDFAKLLDMGGSGWDEPGEDTLEAAEDPAGVGLFCLAGREVIIRSRGQKVVIPVHGWTGAVLPVVPDTDGDRNAETLQRGVTCGTVLEFQDEAWNRETVEPHAVFTGLEVIVDGETCERQPFVSPNAAHHGELGCRIEVITETELSRWHRLREGRSYCGDIVLINFHGQLIALQDQPVDESGLRYLVDLTGEPTGIRLMLPARTRLVENGAYRQLLDALELEGFRYIQRRGTHNLPYEEYRRAQALGIDLPEATPKYRVGLLYSDGSDPEPVEVGMPEGFALQRCYRVDPELEADDEFAVTNVHLLAALGRFETPFVPVDIDSRYNGYSWAKLPTVTQLEVAAGSEIHSDYLWSGRLTCVASLTLTAHTSDGKVFSSPVCMACLPCDDAAEIVGPEDRVAVTPVAKGRLSSSEVWHHLGGWDEEGDTYQSQEYDFERQLDRFWADVIGPDEHVRQRLVEATSRISDTWTSITIAESGAVTIQFPDRTSKTLQVPPSTLSAEASTQNEE